MKYVISTNFMTLKNIDNKILNDIDLTPTNVGRPPHVPFDECRTDCYAEIIKHPARDEWAYTYDTLTAPYLEAARAAGAPISTETTLTEDWIESI